MPDINLAKIPVIILAGGLATRLRPITSTIPKAMVPVAGEPFIIHQLRLLHAQGFRRIILSVGYLGEQIQEYLGSGAHLGLEIHYVFDGPQLLGTGGALRRILPMLQTEFWVLYGDSYLEIDYSKIYRYFLHHQPQGLMTVLHNNNQWDSSNVIYENNSLIAYNKRNYDPRMAYIDYGASILHPQALNRIPENIPFDLSDLYSELVAERNMIGYEVFQRFYEIGSPQGLQEAEAYFLQKRIR